MVVTDLIGHGYDWLGMHALTLAHTLLLLLLLLERRRLLIAYLKASPFHFNITQNEFEDTTMQTYNFDKALWEESVATASLTLPPPIADIAPHNLQ